MTKWEKTERHITAQTRHDVTEESTAMQSRKKSAKNSKSENNQTEKS